MAFTIPKPGMAFAFHDRGTQMNRIHKLPPIAAHIVPPHNPKPVLKGFKLPGINPNFQPPVLPHLPLFSPKTDQFEPQGSPTLPPNHRRKSEHYFLFFPAIYPKEWARVCPAPRRPGADPPMLQVAKTDSRKQEMAERLSNWVLEEVQKTDAEVAIVARGGSRISKTQDKTWMEHSGILIRNPRTRQWEVYNLLNDFCDQSPKCDLWRNEPLDFFYSQPNYDNEALLLLPDKKTQRKLKRGIESGEYKKLLFTNNYNLITRFDGNQSLNCNKWVLMNLIAAEMENYDPDAVLKKIGETFQPGRVRVCPVLRPIARQHPTILQEEAPLVGPINTVTAESLYRSSRFKQKMFYSGKTV